ncbi:MAG TPA: anticodon nuclease [Opitutae bacterium]|nr:anticodon nuclease [Opitutae bacterium]
MSQTLETIAQQLEASEKKVQLIYAFNGSGKTRLSRKFKERVAPKAPVNIEEAEDEEPDTVLPKILYYNAFTEDLFYWDNDLTEDIAPKLIIQPNGFTSWVLNDQGQDQNIISNFQYYTSDKLTPHFNEAYEIKGKDGNVLRKVPKNSEVTFSFERGNQQQEENIKLSKGEESNFIWSVFYTLIDQVVETLNITEVDERDTDQFNDLKYIFIDDPVSSLDDNHLIRLAVDIATLIKRSHFYDLQGLKFIVTTHNPLFYNVLCNEFSRDDKKLGWKAKQFSKHKLVKFEDGTADLEDQPTDSPFSYHLFLNAELNRAIEAGQIHKYHFNFLRNILEKTSTFLGYKNWEELLPRTSDGTTDAYAKRIVNWGSHSKHAGDEIRDLDEEDKRVLRFLADSINQENRFHFRQESAQSTQQAETAT